MVDFRLAGVKNDGAFTPFVGFESAFHNLQPHPALTSPENEADYLRLIADGCIAILLPSEDLSSDCERTLIREILASLILRKGLDLMSEPYMMYETIHNVLSDTSIMLIIGYPDTDSAESRTFRTNFYDPMGMVKLLQSLCLSSSAKSKHFYFIQRNRRHPKRSSSHFDRDVNLQTHLRNLIILQQTNRRNPSNLCNPSSSHPRPHPHIPTKVPSPLAIFCLCSSNSTSYCCHTLSSCLFHSWIMLI